MKGTKVNSIINRIHVAQPKSRDEVVRPAFIPESVQAKNGNRYDWSDPERKRLAKDREVEEGGPGVFSINMKGLSHPACISCQMTYSNRQLPSHKS